MLPGRKPRRQVFSWRGSYYKVSLLEKVFLPNEGHSSPARSSTYLLGGSGIDDWSLEFRFTGDSTDWFSVTLSVVEDTSAFCWSDEASVASVVAGDLVWMSTLSVLSILCTVRSGSFLSATETVQIWGCLLWLWKYVSENCVYWATCNEILNKKKLRETYLRNYLSRLKTKPTNCAPSSDSDQSGHLPSLISLHCVLNGWLRTQAFFMWTTKTEGMGRYGCIAIRAVWYDTYHDISLQWYSRPRSEIPVVIS